MRIDAARAGNLGGIQILVYAAGRIIRTTSVMAL